MDDHAVVSFFEKQPHDFRRCVNSFRNLEHQTFVGIHCFHLSEEQSFLDFCHNFDRNDASFDDLYKVHFYINSLN